MLCATSQARPLVGWVVGGAFGKRHNEAGIVYLSIGHIRGPNRTACQETVVGGEGASSKSLRAAGRQCRVLTAQFGTLVSKNVETPTRSSI